MLHIGNAPPKIATDRKLAELKTASAHPLEIKASVALFVFERLEHAAPELSRRIREFQQHKSHQLSGQQFVVGKKVQHPPTFLVVAQPLQAREIRWGGT